MNLINNPRTLMTAAKANATAAQLNAPQIDDWVYTAVHCPKGTGYSFVECHEADGTYIGTL